MHGSTTIAAAAVPTMSGLARWSPAPLPSTGPFPLHFSHDSSAGRYRCHRIEPCGPVGHKYRIRAITIDGTEEDIITVDDLAKFIDDHDGGPPGCSLKRHPYEFEATHRETIGLHSPGQPFAKPARYPLVFGGARQVDKPWRRPWGELTSRTTYRPDRQTYATLQRDDQAVIDEIDAAIEASLKTGTCSALSIARAAATEILGHHPITNIKNRDLRFDAFWRLADRKRYLPGLKDYGHAIADALQASFWILQLDAETSIRTETPGEKRRRKSENFLERERALSSKGTGAPLNKMGAPGGRMVTTDVGRELLRDIHPDRELLRRFLPPKWKGLTKDDVTAARIVIANSISILHLAHKEKKRRHLDADGSYTTGRSIVIATLRDRLSAREIAAKLGLDPSGSGVTKRFWAAIEAISEVVGPIKSTREELAEKLRLPLKSLFPQIRVFTRPTGEGKRLAVDDALREEAARSYDKVSKKIRPPISHYWSAPKAALWSTGWFNIEARNRAPRLFILICKYQSRGWWATEEEVDDAYRRQRMAESGCRAIWSGACDVWQPTNEDTRLLDFVPICDWEKMRSERAHLIHLVRVPRGYSTSIGSLNFCGPVVEKDGRVYPRVYSSNRIIAGGAAVDDAWLSVETATRFERAVTRADDEPLLTNQCPT
jgi:hypothetical protein